MSNRNLHIYRMVIAALLCAIGIIIPTFSPLKILIEPASFTLASHVAIFFAMFISPPVAIFVALGTTFGFLLGGFPLVIVMRALTHVVFATLGAFWLKKYPNTLLFAGRTFGFNCAMAVIHAVCEVLVVMPFYFGNMLSVANYDKGFLFSVALLVGVGTLIHSSVDFYISVYLWKALSKVGIGEISTVAAKRRE